MGSEEHTTVECGEKSRSPRGETKDRYSISWIIDPENRDTRSHEAAWIRAPELSSEENVAECCRDAIHDTSRIDTDVRALVRLAAHWVTKMKVVLNRAVFPISRSFTSCFVRGRIGEVSQSVRPFIDLLG